MMGAAFYIVVSTYLQIASVVDILSIQSTLMFIGLVFFIIAAYKFAKLGKA